MLFSVTGRGYYCMMGSVEILILLGALAGGFASGLTGFGTGISALPFWLFAVSPALAAPLVVICSVVAQLQNLRHIWRSIDWRRVAPFVACGIFGVPVGTLLLGQVSAGVFKLAVGCLMVAYSLLRLARDKQPVCRSETPLADAGIGLAGGVLGGFAGLSGILPTIWVQLRGWSKTEQRGLFQVFNLSILTLALGTQALGGFVTPELGRLVLFALPGTLCGAWLGHRLYTRLGDRGFTRIVLTLLLFGGLSLIVTAL